MLTRPATDQEKEQIPLRSCPKIASNIWNHEDEAEDKERASSIFSRSVQSTPLGWTKAQS